ncbi:MAG TPA: ribosome silencing factor [Candidatus Acidoferrales bacterium]|nr:ribosome silencing factor [Candidatus Acidoferrales bacterium]
MKAAKTLDLVEQAAQAALDKKAADLVLLDLDGVATLSGYFLLCTGESSRQVQAISNGVEEHLRELGLKPHHVEGYRHAEWILLDYLDFVVHVFSPQARAFYDLERLWRPAKRLAIPEDKRRK